MSRINFSLSWAEHEKKLHNLGTWTPGHSIRLRVNADSENCEDILINLLKMVTFLSMFCISRDLGLTQFTKRMQMNRFTA